MRSLDQLFGGSLHCGKREQQRRPKVFALRCKDVFESQKRLRLYNVDRLLRRRVHLCKRYEQNGRGVPKLRSGPFLYVFEQPSMHGMEDLLGGPARQDERELGCEPDLHEVFDRAI